MAFNPASPLNITHQKYTAIPVPVQITVDIPVDTFNVIWQSKPSWIDIVNVVVGVNSATFFIRVKQSVADTLNPGLYSGTMTFIAYDVNTYAETDLGNFTVNLTLEGNTYLALDPTIMTFEYLIGNPVPVSKTLQIDSENNWSIIKNQSWVTTSVTNGSNAAAVQIGVDPTGLAVGVYEATVTVDDGNFTRELSIYFTITEEVTVVDYLYINPTNFNFKSELNVANATTKNLNIDTSNAWTSVKSESWITMSATAGNSGIQDIDISVDSAALAVGVYQGNIAITSNGIIKKLYITLRVIDIYVTGIVSDTLYYADDRNQLEVSSIDDNIKLVLDITTSNLEENLNYPVKRPYFKGAAKKIVGLETNKLLKSVLPTSNLISRIKNDIKPITLNITAYDEDIFTGGQSSVATFQNLKFLKGYTPSIAGRLSYVPSNIIVSNKAIIQLSIVSANSPTNAVITGAIDTTINGALANELYVYTFLMNLSEYVLIQGDAFTISFGGQTIDVIIDNSNVVESNMIAFDNEWGEYEYFECKGKLTENSIVKATYQDKAESGKSHTRVLEANPDAKFTLNTGYIQTQEEVNWLSKILNNKRMFIYQNGLPLEVILTTKKMEIYKTRKHNHAFRLNFKKAIK